MQIHEWTSEKLKQIVCGEDHHPSLPSRRAALDELLRRIIDIKSEDTKRLDALLQLVIQPKDPRGCYLSPSIVQLYLGEDGQPVSEKIILTREQLDEAIQRGQKHKCP